MKHSILLGYQLFTGLADASAGILLILAPELTLRLMRLDVSPGTLPFLSYIGVFVLSVGIACLYGGFLSARGEFAAKLEVVWLLTAITRGLVALFVVLNVMSGTLERGWLPVAITDGVFAVIQAIGLFKGWLADAAI